MTILIVTNSNDPTVDYVESRFRESGIKYQRLNTDVLFTQLKNTVYIGRTIEEDRKLIYADDIVYQLDDIRGVWYRRPVPPLLDPNIISEQARKYASDEGYYYVRCLWKMLEDRNWVSKPEAISWANAKLHQLQLARQLGFKIPRTLATTDPEKAVCFYNECDGKVVVKPFTVATLEYGTDIVSILTNRVLVDDLRYIDQVSKTITFFQEEIPKLYEVRVTVIGDDVYSAKIDSQSDKNRSVDWRSTSPKEPLWTECSVPSWVTDRCEEMVKKYNLSFGAFDFAYTPDGGYVFFELNSNGQWAWLEIELGLPMTKSLVKVLTK